MCDVFPGLPSTPMSAVARIWEELDFSAIDKQGKQITNVFQKNMSPGVTWAGVGLRGGICYHQDILMQKKILETR